MIPTFIYRNLFLTEIYSGDCWRGKGHVCKLERNSLPYGVFTIRCRRFGSGSFIPSKLNRIKHFGRYDILLCLIGRSISLSFVLLRDLSFYGVVFFRRYTFLWPYGLYTHFGTTWKVGLGQRSTYVGLCKRSTTVSFSDLWTSSGQGLGVSY